MHCTLARQVSLAHTKLGRDVETEIRVEVNFLVSKLDDDVIATLDKGFCQHRLQTGV